MKDAFDKYGRHTLGEDEQDHGEYRSAFGKQDDGDQFEWLGDQKRNCNDDQNAPRDSPYV